MKEDDDPNPDMLDGSFFRSAREELLDRGTDWLRAAGAREEREAVVRWLRVKAAKAAGRDADEEAAALATVAAVIEAGEHRKP